MAGFGTELLLLCGLGYVVLGPKRMHVIVQHIARAKADFEQTQRALKAELTTHLDAAPQEQDGQSGPT